MNEPDENRRNHLGSLRTALRESEERILRRICPALKIEDDISLLSLTPLHEFTDLFPDTHILAIRGPGFERIELPPVSSVMLIALRLSNPDATFVELSPRSNGLREVLASNWNLLPDLSPVQLAKFILTTHTTGVVDHEVLTDMTSLDASSRRDEGFVLNQNARRIINSSPAKTFTSVSSNSFSIHALTLYGWMHEKQELGVTDITVFNDGDYQIGDRRTICDPVFDEIPRIWY